MQKYGRTILGREILRRTLEVEERRILELARQLLGREHQAEEWRCACLLHYRSTCIE